MVLSVQHSGDAVRNTIPERGYSGVDRISNNRYSLDRATMKDRQGDSLGDAVRAEFRKSGRSIKWLAEASGVGYASAYGFVHGTNDPLSPTLSRMAKALGLKLTTTKRGKPKGR